MDFWGLLVAVCVAFAGGSGFAKIVEIISDRIRGASARRRAEIDKMASQLSRAVDEEKRLSRRERICLEYISELRRMLLDQGVPSSELPKFDLGD